MTAAKAQSLKASLTAEFRGIFELFDFILMVRGGVVVGPSCVSQPSRLPRTGATALLPLRTRFLEQASTKPSLINATLVTLQRYVTWIPDNFVFETRLLETLVLKFLPVPAFRVNTLMVLTEVRLCVYMCVWPPRSMLCCG